MKMRRLLLGAVLGGLGLMLLADTFIFDTYPADEESGRQKGCYTTLERWVGVKSPSVIADIERIAGGVLLLTGGIVAWPRRSSGPGTTVPV